MPSQTLPRTLRAPSNRSHCDRISRQYLALRPAQRPLSHLTDGSCVPAPNGRSVAASAALRGDVGARESGRRAGRFGVVAPRAAAPERHLPGDGGLGGHASRLPRCQSCHMGGLACTGPQLGAVGDVSASRRVVFECRPSMRPCRTSCACASFARVERGVVRCF